MAFSSWPGIVIDPVNLRAPEMVTVIDEFVSFMMSFIGGVFLLQESGTDAVYFERRSALLRLTFLFHFGWVHEDAYPINKSA